MTADVKNYRDLIVWQKAMSLVEETYRLVKKLPKEETYALSDQIRRAVVSIPSNIAEGQQRRTAKEFISFLSIARGSNAEVQTQLEICVCLHYLQQEEIQTAMELSSEIAKMLNTMMSKLTPNN